MKVRKCDHYDQFECLGGPCPDNCCIGDELVIDEAVWQRYMAVPGPFGDRLRETLKDAVPDGTDYVLEVDGRCPFLNDANYCDIVLTLGPEWLGEVCATFPRTGDWFAGCFERSHMLACPEAARQLLGRREPMAFIESDEPDEDGSVPAPAEEEAVLLLRSEVLKTLSGRRKPLADRIRDAAGLCGADSPPSYDRAFIATILGSMPWAHRVWPDALNALESWYDQTEESLSDAVEETLAKAGPYAAEQLYAYFIFRYMPWAADDGDPAGKLSLAVFSAHLISDLARANAFARKTPPGEADVVAAAGIWSKQLEFAEENLFYLFDLL